MKKPIKQSDETFEDINQLIWQHLDDRDWTDLNARSLAISLSLEANELLEHYQWSEDSVGDREELAMELADTFIYAFQFAQATGIDVSAAIRAKLAKAAQKYPAELFKGKSGAEERAAWINVKKNYRKDTTL